MKDHLDIESNVRHGFLSTDVEAIGPAIQALATCHGLATVVDEMAGAISAGRLVEGLVHLCGWDHVAALVLEARPRSAPQTPEPF